MIIRSFLHKFEKMTDMSFHVRGHTYTTWSVEGGVSQMTISSHKSYLVKMTTKGGGGQEYPKI